MADEIDNAQEMAERFTAAALDDHRRAQEPANYTGIYCVDCDEEIPEARRKAMPGCRRCIGCQQTHENWRPM